MSTYDIEKVTSRPWQRYPNSKVLGPLYASLIEGIPSDIGMFLEIEDAEHTLHCVNHHEELVAMLETTLSWLDECCEAHCGGPAEFPEARALLAKVKG